MLVFRGSGSGGYGKHFVSGHKIAMGVNFCPIQPSDIECVKGKSLGYQTFICHLVICLMMISLGHHLSQLRNPLGDQAPQDGIHPHRSEHDRDPVQEITLHGVPDDQNLRRVARSMGGRELYVTDPQSYIQDSPGYLFFVGFQFHGDLLTSEANRHVTHTLSKQVLTLSKQVGTLSKQVSGDSPLDTGPLTPSWELPSVFTAVFLCRVLSVSVGAVVVVGEGVVVSVGVGASFSASSFVNPQDYVLRVHSISGLPLRSPF